MAEGSKSGVQEGSSAKADDSLGPLQVIEQLAPDGWRHKLAKAAAQLIAGSRSGALVYGEMRERLDTVEGRSIVSRGMAEAVLQQSVNDPELMERAKARFLSSTLQKQENLEAVIVGASQPILALPSPNTEGESEASTDELDLLQNSDPTLELVDEQPLNADWAATFSDIAENASTDELRERLSRVLAGELSSPGTYSRSTVRRIAELEKADLEAMQRVIGFVVGDVIVRTSIGGTDVPSIDMLLPLIEAGFISESSNSLVKTYGPAAEDGKAVHFCGKLWALQITLKKDMKFEVPITQLTRTGIAVTDLLGRADEREILERFAENLTSNYDSVEIGRMVGADRIKLPLKRLRPKPIVDIISLPNDFSFAAPQTS